MDFRPLGNFRKQSQGQVLHDHQNRPETTHTRGRELETDLRHDRPTAAAGAPEVTACFPGCVYWLREFTAGSRAAAPLTISTKRSSRTSACSPKRTSAAA